MPLVKIHNFVKHSYILYLNIPFLSEMNAESTAVLHDRIYETKHEILVGGNHHPLVANVAKHLGSLKVNRKILKMSVSLAACNSKLKVYTDHTTDRTDIVLH